jgi:hypothetical protein
MRITKQTLRGLVTHINERLDRPPGMMDIGHLTIDGNHIGYQLEEELNGRGSVYAHTGRLTAREMFYFLQGMIKGVNTPK